MKSVNQEMQWFGVEACAGRVKYDDPRMYHFRSWEPKTPFAPRFDCPMWIDQVEPVSYTHLTLPTILLV